MQYPEYMTAEEIMEFEYEYNQMLDELFLVNAELQIAGQEQAEEEFDC